MKLRQLVTNFLRQFKRLLFPLPKADLPLHPHHSIILSQGRERILTAMLRATAGLGLCSLLNLLPRLVRDGQWISIAIYFASLGAVLVGGINRRIDYRLRASLFLLIGYGVAVLDLVDYGLGEDARVFLFGFAVVATMLLGPRVGLGALSLSVATLAIVGWLMSTGQFTPVIGSHVYSGVLTMETVIFICANFLLSAGLVMAALHVLLRDFDFAWQRERLAVNLVEQERYLLEQRVADRTRELVVARDQAVAASSFKTELLARVSHELRTPLAAILGFTEMLRVGVYGALSDKQLQLTQEVIDSTYFLTNLVGDLLSQAQLDAGKFKLYINSFNCTHIFDNVHAKMNPLAQAKGLTLTTEIAADVPATLWGDPHRIQQILINLVSNAIKFTEQGAVRMRLYQPDANHWALQVSDTGPGIPSEAQIYIFEPFRQVDGSVTRTHGGVGLGLSIVKQLTTLMGGEITLTSEVDHGSVFTVSLPLVPVQETTV
ncbi:MAG TPA: HAMP domain-containing sensor histidine kinase [Anaerolineae bacterium]|nr:HAMP domain-containing sensor histidine kinase [Anaerolineae bacterium]